MASINKVIIDQDDLTKKYCVERKSTTEIAVEIGVCASTVRYRLKQLGILRTRAEGIRNAATQGKLGINQRGKKREFSEKWKANLKASLIKRGELYSKGMSVKPSGYLEYTRGKNKFRSVHVVTVENQIGRKMRKNEVVHHKDHNKLNNDISNLELMTRSEHASIHAKENYTKRSRNEYGQFE